MGIFKKLAGFLGFSKDEEVRDLQQQQHNNNNNNNIGGVPVPQYSNINNNSVPRKGFSVPVQVPVSRDLPAPILIPCFITADGGLQGLRWYAKRLRMDEDGDVADEFLNEIPPDTPSSTEENHRKFHRFELKYSTEPAKVPVGSDMWDAGARM